MRGSWLPFTTAAAAALLLASCGGGEGGDGGDGGAPQQTRDLAVFCAAANDAGFASVYAPTNGWQETRTKIGEASATVPDNLEPQWAMVAAQMEAVAARWEAVGNNSDAVNAGPVLPMPDQAASAFEELADACLPLGEKLNTSQFRLRIPR